MGRILRVENTKNTNQNFLKLLKDKGDTND